MAAKTGNKTKKSAGKSSKQEIDDIDSDNDNQNDCVETELTELSDKTSSPAYLTLNQYGD